MSELGEIYCLTSPSNKKYIGQCVQYLSSGKKHGTIARWKHHINEAKNNKNYCVCLDNAIVKYGADNFKVEVIKICPIGELNYWENYYIEEYNTLKPGGYNLTTGKSFSRQCDETRDKRRKSMIGKNKGKVLSKRNRKREEDNDLPKYVRHYVDVRKEGYRVSQHPLLKDKSFLKKSLSMDEKLELAIAYINSISSSLDSIENEGSTNKRHSEDNS